MKNKEMSFYPRIVGDFRRQIKTLETEIIVEVLLLHWVHNPWLHIRNPGQFF